MAPKHRSGTPSAPSTPAQNTRASTPKLAPTPSLAKASSASPASKSASSSSSPQDILLSIWGSYLKTTPQRVKLIDAFLAFLALVGALQFLYVIIAGNYPFNAFLAGFGATVGQFVLTASLRIQTNPENRSEFTSVSDERAFADFVFGSLILHFFCVNFIN